jgi:DNA-binding FadR family transcriptional regulator
MQVGFRYEIKEIASKTSFACKVLSDRDRALDGNVSLIVVEATQKLSDVCHQQMLNLIHDGTWAVNTRLPSEDEMANHFGVSRPVIRQALARLREDGLITSRRGSGSFVTGDQSGDIRFPDIASIADLELFTCFLEGVEGEAAALAAERCSEQQLNSLRALSACSNGSSGMMGASEDFEFHVGIADASGNPFYANTLRSLRAQITLCMNLTWKLATLGTDFKAQVKQQHLSILDAIEAGDSEKARAAMRYHVRWAHSRLMNGQPGNLELTRPAEEGAGRGKVQ